jgi:beta-N-acetylglucosaminidase
MTLYPDVIVKKRGFYEIRDGEVYHTVEANGNLSGRFLVGPSSKKSSEPQFTENVQDVFDSPYQFASINSKAPYTSDELNRFLKTLDGSPLIGKGKAFKDAEAKHGINALFLLAVAGHESNYGMSAIAKDKNNLYGFKATDEDPSGNATAFSSVEASIEAAADLFANKYVKGSMPTDPILGIKMKGSMSFMRPPHRGERKVLRRHIVLKVTRLVSELTYFTNKSVMTDSSIPFCRTM